MNFHAVIVLGIALGFLAACSQTPPPQNPGTSMEIIHFSVSSNKEATGTPLSFSWKIETEALFSCKLDTDNDGQAEYSFTPCETEGSQSHSFGEEGDYTARFTVTGTDSLSKTASFIIVEPSTSNTPPVANDDTAKTVISTAVAIDVLSNDSDIDNDSLVLASFDTQTPEGGKISIIGHMLRYTPTTGFTGTDSFSYTVSDGNGGTDTAAVAVVVSAKNPNNSPPIIAAIKDQSILRNTLNPRSLSVELSIEDPDSDSFTIIIDSDKESVIADDTLACSLASCLLSLEPSAETTATATIALTVNDGSGGEAQTSFKLHVLPHLVKTSADNLEDEELIPDSLRDAVQRATDGDVIAFDTAAEFMSTRTIILNRQLELNKDLTIEGTGLDTLSLSGDDKVRVINVTNTSTIILKDMTITRGLAPLETFDFFLEPFPLGGGIFVDSGSQLTLSSVKVIGNKAMQVITSNQEDKVLGAGGGIANLGMLTVKNSRIADNAASDAGGGILNFSTDTSTAKLSLYTTVLSANKATSEEGIGGAIASNGETLLDNTVIGGSEPEEGNQADQGGGIYSGVFDENVDLEPKLTLQNNSQVLYNQASFKGGGINNVEGIVSIESSLINNNLAEKSGGGIRNEGVHGFVDISHSVIADNEATDTYGGGVRNDGGRVIIFATTIIGNITEGKGGGIYNSKDGVIEIDETSLTANTALESGGAIHQASGRLRLSNCIIGGEVVEDANMAKSGGGIYISKGELSVISSTIQHNVADNGGGMYVKDQTEIDNSEVIKNEAERGGGIYNKGTLRMINQSQIAHNFASSSGGGIYQEGSEETVLIIEDSAIHNNTSQNGGGISSLAKQGQLSLKRSKLFANSAGEYGGGLYNIDSIVSILETSHVFNNTADNGGGGIGSYAPDGFGKLIVEDSIVGHEDSTLANRATSSGGGIEATGQLIIHHSQLIGNQTNGDGGGIWLRNGTLEVSHSQLSNNKAANGGAIYNQRGMLSIHNATVGDPDLNDTSSEGNRAKGHGAGIFNSGGTITFQGIIAGNQASSTKSQGGGVFNQSEPNQPGFVLIEEKSTIEANQAALGGGIANHANLEIVSMSIIRANSADFGGGVYNADTGLFDITGKPQATVVENSAKTSGGGVFNVSGIFLSGVLGQGVSCDTVKDNEPNNIATGNAVKLCPK